MKIKLYLILFLLFILAGCKRPSPPTLTPWGTLLGDTATADRFTLRDIVLHGELIAVTLSGPDTYYDYRGHPMGSHYLLGERFAAFIGTSLRVEVCKDTAEMVSRLKRGDADVVLFPLPHDTRFEVQLAFCGPTDTLLANGSKTLRGWAVMADNTELLSVLNQWYNPALLSEVKREENFRLSERSVHRRVYAPLLNKTKGLISNYDGYFKQYAPAAHVDWRLMAAQCYQESCFDPNAKSWAGACGLMQIMPATARHLGLPPDKMFNPEANIAAASRYINELSSHFSDVPSAEERLNFVLAAYNAGNGHVRDAMALAQKYGADKHRWSQVAPYILKLSQPQFYQDPVVRHGYMRGTETVDYVARIRDRYAQYAGAVAGTASFGVGGGNATPHRASKRHRFKPSQTQSHSSITHK